MTKQLESVEWSMTASYCILTVAKNQNRTRDVQLTIVSVAGWRNPRKRQHELRSSKGMCGLVTGLKTKIGENMMLARCDLPLQKKKSGRKLTSFGERRWGRLWGKTRSRTSQWHELYADLELSLNELGKNSSTCAHGPMISASVSSPQSSTFKLGIFGSSEYTA